MRTRTLAGGGAVVMALALTGCSSAPEVGGLSTDGLIAGCLEQMQPMAEDSGNSIKGTVIDVATQEPDDDEEGTLLHVAFDAVDDDGDEDDAACTMTIIDGEVTAMEGEAPDDDPGTEVEDAAQRWNDKHAEDWAEGDGPEPIEVPEPKDPDRRQLPN